jgi:UDP-GlcNAc:undecaprenyl-phosphate/decaprenyl-phosphate GlcNAc-1-phosphate transferase
MNTLIVTFGIAALISLVCTEWIRKWARGQGWLDHPDSIRKLHAFPVPRVGGLSIFLSLTLTVAIVCLLPTASAAHFRDHLHRALTILGLSAAMMLLGLWDDIKGLSP